MKQIIYDDIEGREPESWELLTADPLIKSMYEISTYGRVRNINTGKILKPDVDKDGYLKFTLQSVNNTKIKRFSHRLVGLQYIPNPLNKPEINHIRVEILDDKPVCNHDDNYYKNLEWCTRQENIDHSIANKLEAEQPFGENAPRSKFSDDTAIYICLLLERGFTTKMILRKLGFKSTKEPNYKAFSGLIKTLRTRSAWHQITKMFDY